MRHSINSINRSSRSFPMMIALAMLSFVGISSRAADLQEVTVTVPMVKTIGRDASGAPIQQVSASARVQYDPIMLTTNSGRALLQDKVADVARRLCRDIDMAVPPPAVDEESCVQQAVHGAKVQIAAAAAARKAG